MVGGWTFGGGKSCGSISIKPKKGGQTREKKMTPKSIATVDKTKWK